MVLFINRANRAPGVHMGPAPGGGGGGGGGEVKGKTKKSSSQKPQGPELSYFVCSNI